MNFFVNKPVLVAVVLGLIGTVYAPVYSPGVAERIIKNALVEVKKTGTIKDVVQFKQAYQDLPAMSKENYQEDYEDILKALQKSVVKKEVISKDKPKEVISEKTEKEKNLEELVKKQDEERKKEKEEIEEKKQKQEKTKKELEEIKRKKEELDKQMQSKEQEEYKKKQEALELQRKELEVKLEYDKKQEEINRKKREENEKERLEKERLEKERIEKEKLEKERLEKERIEKERLEKERIEREQIEKERIEKERLEKEKLEKEKQEKLRLEKERIEKEKLDKEQIEKEKLEREETVEGIDDLPELEDEEISACKTLEEAKKESKKCSLNKSVIVHNTLSKSVYVGIYMLKKIKDISGLCKDEHFKVIEIPKASYKPICSNRDLLKNFKLLILGDDKSFKGVYTKKIDEFTKQGCLIELNNNDYISHKKIIEVTNQMLGNNTQKKKKKK